MKNIRFVELLVYVGNGLEVAGGVAELANALGQKRIVIRDVRKGKQGLPVYACIKLAELVGAAPLAVIAASALVTERASKRRAVFLPYVESVDALSAAYLDE